MDRSLGGRRSAPVSLLRRTSLQIQVTSQESSANKSTNCAKHPLRCRLELYSQQEEPRSDMSKLAYVARLIQSFEKRFVGTCITLAALWATDHLAELPKYTNYVILGMFAIILG